MRHSNFIFGLAALACVSVAQSAAAGDAPPRVTIETSLGNITLELDQVHAPQTVRNFLRYVSEQHFDGTVFYRVVPGFVIQAGSYMADGSYRSPHAAIPLEADNGLLNTRGSIAMARGDTPASADAEFFIDLSDNADLDHKASDTANTTGYTVFGHVVSGMDVVDKIAGVQLGDKGPFPGAAPVEPVVIRKMTALP
jgi:cyclophilin family peptidyl-prolyl cis-trans isomerase